MTDSDRSASAPGSAYAALSSWYRVSGRHALPWRQTGDPWLILASEILLQQTPVSRVLAKWPEFVGRWEDPLALAETSKEDFLRFWKGLGYPRRALALQAAAQRLAAAPFPRTIPELISWKGVGTYTARAVLRLAFDDPDCPLPLDTNIERIGMRLAGRVCSRIECENVLRQTFPPEDVESPRDLVLALFDLGAAYCLPREPLCTSCPLSRRCASAFTPGPVRSSRRPQRYEGSFRQLRGAVLVALLAQPRSTPDDLVRAILPLHASPGDIRIAAESLARDGLVSSQDSSSS